MNRERGGEQGWAAVCIIWRGGGSGRHMVECVTGHHSRMVVELEHRRSREAAHGEDRRSQGGARETFGLWALGWHRAKAVAP
jgi:hypothetical protein